VDITVFVIRTGLSGIFPAFVRREAGCLIKKKRGTDKKERGCAVIKKLSAESQSIYILLSNK